MERIPSGGGGVALQSNPLKQVVEGIAFNTMGIIIGGYLT
jgi:hypothetical protein